MRVLAIDTALEACSAAVLDTERGGILASGSIPMLRGHAEALLPLVSRVMSEAALEFCALDRVAVTVGPGSFTGLRVGVSAARGIAVAAGKPAVGLTTLAALAAPYIAIDARNEQVYMQMVGSGGRSLIQPRVASLRDAVRDAANARARLVGSAAAMMAAAWPAGVQPPPVVDAARAPIIDWVAHLGAAAAQALSLPKPLYLRAPDAQPQDAAHLPRR